MTNLGSLLKELRGERSFREMEKITGLSHTYLSSLEKGVDPRSGSERKPTPSVLKKLSEKLSIDYSTLMEAAGYLPEDESVSIGEYIKRERNKNNYSLLKLGQKINMRVSNLSEIETGKRNPPRPEVLRKIANGLWDCEETRDEHFFKMMELAGHIEIGTLIVKGHIDLSSISTDELLAEIKRRMK